MVRLAPTSTLALIEHCVSVADIKSNTKWCMSSGMLNCIEEFIGGMSAKTKMLLKYKMNKNSQKFSS